MREKAKKTERRRRFLIQGGIGVVVIAIIVIVVLVVNQNLANNVTLAAKAGGPKNMISDGILFHGVSGTATPVETAAIKKGGKPVATDQSKYKGKANIVEYIDLQCPYCNEFETTNLAAVEKWVAAGKATVEIHPITILDQPTDDYSSRAGSAMACVANYEPNEFLSVLATMYKDQPAEDNGGLTNSQIATNVASGGATSSKVRACINGVSFKSWITAATSRAEADVYAKHPSDFPNGNASTPAIFVNGQYYSGVPASSPDWLTSASEFSTFVDSVVPGTTN